jgi:hypothetical protein
VDIEDSCVIFKHCSFRGLCEGDNEPIPHILRMLGSNVILSGCGFNGSHKVTCLNSKVSVNEESRVNGKSQWDIQSQEEKNSPNASSMSFSGNCIFNGKTVSITCKKGTLSFRGGCKLDASGEFIIKTIGSDVRITGCELSPRVTQQSFSLP